MFLLSLLLNPHSFSHYSLIYSVLAVRRISIHHEVVDSPTELKIYSPI